MSVNSDTNPNTSDLFKNISVVMQRVQGCPGNPFPMNELVTLESCFRQACFKNPKLALIFDKLANECLFVAPDRKVAYLNRSKESKEADRALQKKTNLMRRAIAVQNKDIDHYSKELKNLRTDGRETRKEIKQLELEISLLAGELEFKNSSLACSLDCALSSFKGPIETIKNKVPMFIYSIQDSSLMKQFDLLPDLRAKFLLGALKQGTSFAQQLAHRQDRLLIYSLKAYLKSLTSLFRDLVEIHKVYSTEVVEEVEHLEALRTHLEFLKKPLGDVPKLTIVEQCRNYPLSDLLKQLPEHIEVPADDCKGDELLNYFKDLTGKLKNSWKMC